MQKTIFFILMVFHLTFAVKAEEIVHGINVNTVYTQGDWNNKNEIREIIQDYALLLRYEKELAECDRMQCLDILAEKVIYHFYPFEVQKNFAAYQNYIKATFEVYGIANCLDKYNMPTGSTCNENNEAATTREVKRLISMMITNLHQQLSDFNFIKAYKE